MPKLQRSLMVFYWSSAKRDFAYDFRCTIYPVWFHLFTTLNLGRIKLNSKVRTAELLIKSFEDFGSWPIDRCPVKRTNAGRNAS